MIKTRVIPCLLLLDKGLVKTIKFNNPRYIGDPINTVKIFNEKEVDELIFLDISATIKDREPPMNFISQIASECFMPLCYGGGIKSVENIKKIFALGVEKVSINNYAIENPSFIEEAANIFGSQSIVVSMDVKKNLFGEYKIFIHSGKKPTDLDPVKFAIWMEKIGAGELLINSIDRDGTMEGYDLELTRKVSEAVSIPVITSGGAGKIENFADAVKETGVSAVAAGSFFVFYGKHHAVLINFPTAEELKEVLG